MGGQRVGCLFSLGLPFYSVAKVWDGLGGLQTSRHMFSHGDAQNPRNIPTCRFLIANTGVVP